MYRVSLALLISIVLLQVSLLNPKIAAQELSDTLSTDTPDRVESPDTVSTEPGEIQPEQPVDLPPVPDAQGSPEAGEMMTPVQDHLNRPPRTDYRSFPKRDADFTHMALEMMVVGGPLVNGEVAYELSLLREGVDTLRLDAINMDIDLVEWDGSEASHDVVGDQLVIALPDDVTPDQNYTLRIRYNAAPAFGVFEDHRGTIWSSGLPGSVRHWLPVVDHPRNSFTTDISLIIPATMTAVFGGVPGEESVESIDLKKVRFFTESAVPVSQMRFAVGDFERDRVTAGRHQIHLYAESGLLDGVEKREILEEAYNMFRLAEQELLASYPSRVLNLVVLDDDMWETKAWGAGIVFGFPQLGNLVDQIATGVAAQWLGVRIREERWQDSDAIVMMQAWLLEKFSEYTVETPDDEDLRRQIPIEGHYASFSRDRYAAWRLFMQGEESAHWRDLLDRSVSGLFVELPEVITWYDFASWLYNKNGLWLSESPAPAPLEVEEVASPARYQVVYTLDEQESRLRLTFQAVDQPVDGLVTLVAEEFTMNGSVNRQEISFAGANDEVVVSVSPGVENLTLTPEDAADVELVVEKPFMFWIYQLRNHEDPRKRQEAAVQLRTFTDNPDLQLALLDIIGSESHPDVYAETIRTLAAVTDGASGTDQLFMQRYNSSADPQVLMAIVEAFGNYQNNDAVISRLQSVINGNHPVEVKRAALQSLSQVTDGARFRSLSESILAGSGAGQMAPLVLRQLAREGQAETAITWGQPFLTDSYPWTSRVAVLDLMLDYDASATNWEDRLELLAADTDPRMRLRILDGLQFLAADNSSDLINQRLDREFDDRVIQRLDELQF